MNLTDPKVASALVATVLYIALATGIVRTDRKTNTGGFISLNGMISGLATLPVALPLEYFGRKLDYRSNWQMAIAITLCAGLTFTFVFGAISLGAYFWTFAPPAR